MATPQNQNKDKKMAPQNQKQSTPAVAVAPTTPPVDSKPKTLVVVEVPAAETAAKDAAAAVAAAADAAQQKPPKAEKPKVEKVELKCGNPLGSKESQFVRKGSAVELIYGFLTLPVEKAMTVEQMAKVLHDGAFANHPLESVTTNVRVEIAASKSKRGMHVGRDAQGRYNVNIAEQNRGRVLTPEQQAEKVAKDAAREVKKAERLKALNAKRTEKKAAKDAAAAAKAAGEADAKKTPEQIAAELKAAGVNAKAVT